MREYLMPNDLGSLVVYGVVLALMVSYIAFIVLGILYTEKEI